MRLRRLVRDVEVSTFVASLLWQVTAPSSPSLFPLSFFLGCYEYARLTIRFAA